MNENEWGGFTNLVTHRAGAMIMDEKTDRQRRRDALTMLYGYLRGEISDRQIISKLALCDNSNSLLQIIVNFLVEQEGDFKADRLTSEEIVLLGILALEHDWPVNELDRILNRIVGERS